MEMQNKIFMKPYGFSFYVAFLLGDEENSDVIQPIASITFLLMNLELGTLLYMKSLCCTEDQSILPSCLTYHPC